jgi:hypothetical protein
MFNNVKVKKWSGFVKNFYFFTHYLWGLKGSNGREVKTLYFFGYV